MIFRPSEMMETMEPPGHVHVKYVQAISLYIPMFVPYVTPAVPMLRTELPLGFADWKEEKERERGMCVLYVFIR